MGWFSSIFGGGGDSSSSSSSTAANTTTVDVQVDVNPVIALDTAPLATSLDALTRAGEKQAEATGGMVQKLADTVTANTKTMVDGFQNHLSEQQRTQLLLAGVTAAVALLKDSK
jgi:hypothetical protein